MGKEVHWQIITIVHGRFFSAEKVFWDATDGFMEIFEKESNFRKIWKSPTLLKIKILIYFF